MSVRMVRVARVIQECLASILYKYFTRDVVGFVTITNVVVSPDFGIAKVYFSTVNEDQMTVLSVLNHHKKEIRKKLAKEIRNQFKRVPDLDFFIDSQVQVNQRMDELFEQIKNLDVNYDDKERSN